MEDCEHVALLLNACLILLNITYTQSKWWTGSSQTHSLYPITWHTHFHTRPHSSCLSPMQSLPNRNCRSGKRSRFASLAFLLSICQLCSAPIWVISLIWPEREWKEKAKTGYCKKLPKSCKKAQQSIQYLFLLWFRGPMYSHTIPGFSKVRVGVMYSHKIV